MLDAVLAIALCHNVSPVSDAKEEEQDSVTAYQASSPDEVKFWLDLSQKSTREYPLLCRLLWSNGAEVFA